MDLLLAVCGYSPVENHPTAHTPPHAVPVQGPLVSEVIGSEELSQVPSQESSTRVSNMSITKEKEKEKEENSVSRIEEILDPVTPESSVLLSEVEGKLRRRKKVGVEAADDCPTESDIVNRVVTEGQ
jgi:hypothetical protein